VTTREINEILSSLESNGVEKSVTTFIMLLLQFLFCVLQVSEVLSDKTRLSISGWFHGPPIDRPSPYKELAPTRQSPLQIKVRILQNIC
jgi:hypothetical protein